VLSFGPDFGWSLNPQCHFTEQELAQIFSVAEIRVGKHSNQHEVKGTSAWTYSNEVQLGMFLIFSNDNVQTSFLTKFFRNKCSIRQHRPDPPRACPFTQAQVPSMLDLDC
jgi:hypothetical protein